jgi:hypothetical protein
MQHMPGIYMDSEVAMPVFLIAAGLFVVLSLLIVLAVRSVPSKLILLGVLAMVAGICFTAIDPLVATPALVLVILAAILVLAGLLCVFISFLVQLFTSARTQAGSKP